MRHAFATLKLQWEGSGAGERVQGACAAIGRVSSVQTMVAANLFPLSTSVFVFISSHFSNIRE
jgi:hypothetical protein